MPDFTVLRDMRAGNAAQVRLGILTSVVCLCAFGSACHRKPKALPFELSEVAPGVWAATDNQAATPSAGSNAGFVIGDDGVVVIDTTSNVESARLLLAEIRKRTSLPVKFAIDTHYHLDHVAGNGVFAEAGAVVMAQENVRDWIHVENVRLVTDGAKAAGETARPREAAS